MLSRSDRFQHLQTLLRNRTKRTHHRQFVVEGVRNIDAALRFGWRIDELWYAPERMRSRWAVGVLEQVPLVVETTAELLAELSEREEPSELVAVCRMRDDVLELDAAAPLVVVLDRPSNPGNLGTVVRSADALGGDAVVISGHAADPYDPQAVRASLGALFAMPVVRLRGPQQVLELCERWRTQHGGLQVVAAVADGGIAPAEADLRPPTVLLLGNEARGLAAAYRDGSDIAVQIPMQARAVDSLNLASAAAILLYEAARQRRA